MNRHNVALNIIRQRNSTMHNDDRFLATAELRFYYYYYYFFSLLPSLFPWFNLVIIGRRACRIFDYVRFIRAKSNDELSHYEST